MTSPACGSEEAHQTQGVRLVVDAIPSLAWSARSDGSADFFNQRWLEYTGLSVEQARDWGWTVALHPDDLKGLVDYWRSVLASGQPSEIEGRLRRFDGMYRWFLFRATPSSDNSGKIVKWFGTNTDIEDRKRAELLLAGENLVLEMTAKGDSLKSVLEALFSSQITCDIASGETIQKSGCFIQHPCRTCRQAWGKRVPRERYQQHQREVHLDDRRPSEISEKQRMALQTLHCGIDEVGEEYGKNKHQDDPPSAIACDADCRQQRSRQQNVDGTSVRECHD
jgi:PAS domain S-box-containing protein